MRKVLIIEDSVTQGQSLRLDFEAQNYTVTLASTGFEAYRALKDRLPELIILDYSLPDTDGIMLCKRLKRDNLLRTIPIIMFSSHNKLQNMVQAYEAGADYYVVKDVEGSKVLRLLSDSLFTRRVRQPSVLSA